MNNLPEDAFDYLGCLYFQLSGPAFIGYQSKCECSIELSHAVRFHSTLNYSSFFLCGRLALRRNCAFDVAQFSEQDSNTAVLRIETISSCCFF